MHSLSAVFVSLSIKHVYEFVASWESAEIPMFYQADGLFCKAFLN